MQPSLDCRCTAVRPPARCGALQGSLLESSWAVGMQCHYGTAATTWLHLLESQQPPRTSPPAEAAPAGNLIAPNSSSMLWQARHGHRVVAVDVSPLVPRHTLEAVIGQLDVFVPVNLEHVAPLLVNDQAAHHVAPVKVPSQNLLQQAAGGIQWFRCSSKLWLKGGMLQQCPAFGSVPAGSNSKLAGLHESSLPARLTFGYPKASTSFLMVRSNASFSKVSAGGGGPLSGQPC